jgi:hypothetical protein
VFFKGLWAVCSGRYFDRALFVARRFAEGNMGSGLLRDREGWITGLSLFGGTAGLGLERSERQA